MLNIEYKPIGGVNSAVNDPTCIHLFELARSMDSIVEIGSWHGKTAHALLSGCPGTVYCVDHFNGSTAKSDATHNQSGKEAFIKNCDHFDNLKLLEMYSHEAAKQFEYKSVDMVFIDAGHLYEEILLDLQCWLPKAKKIICGHDYNYSSVKKALDEMNLKCEEPVPIYWEHWL